MENYRLHSRLTVYELRGTDFGVYKCVSKNSLGETESTVRLYGKIIMKGSQNIKFSDVFFVHIWNC